MRIAAILLLLVALASCGSSPQPSSPHPTTPASSLPSSTTVETTTPQQAPATSQHQESAPTTTTPTPVRDVTPGAFCSPEGATGVTKKGVTVTCKGPAPLRWRS
jgi:hypothetical protein